MSAPAARWLAWGLWVVYVVAAVSTFETPALLPIGFATVGAMVAARRPHNAVGWLLLASALTYIAAGTAESYAIKGDAPAAAIWFAGWAWYLLLVPAVLLLPLVFPDGRLLSPRWRPVAWLAVGGACLTVVAVSLRPGPLEINSPQPITNPFGLNGTAGQVVTTAADLGDVVLLTSILLAASSMAVRLHRSQGSERAQMKWFSLLGVLTLVAGVTAVISQPVAENASRPWLTFLSALSFMLTLALFAVGLPLAIGVAILRHRLYDVDLVIKRTLVYGALTATLLAAYLSMVLLLQLALRPVTSDSDLAVAASTLAVAALFRPARSRIQRAVDRQFFRRRYDAARTLEAFVGHLRDELDVESLGADLRGVVHDTMQPTHVSLWLRP